MASAILRQTRFSALQSMFDSLRNGGSFMSHAKLAGGADIVSAAPDVSLQKARNWDEGVSSIFSTTPLNEILKGNQAVIFGLPGAFTGVCSKQHVPSYKNNIDKLKAIGIDSVAGNQRHKSSLVGTSANTRTTTYPISFCEWLAGILDGDGSIQVSKQGYTSLEITMGLEDLRLLRYIQNMLGGSIKMRSGAKAFRYRLHNQLGMIKLMNCINGHIRDSARLLQLHRVCQVLDIPVILPITPDAQSNWFAGFFDADGTIGIAMKNRLPQLCIGVTNQHLQDVESYKAVFGGNIYFDSSRNGYYQWSVQSRKDVIMMLDYFKSSTFRSHKSQRFFLIEEYYSLYDLKAFEPDSIHHKAWLAFLDKWNRLIHCQPAFSSWKDQMKQEIGLDERERELLLEER